MIGFTAAPVFRVKFLAGFCGILCFPAIPTLTHFAIDAIMSSINHNLLAGNVANSLNSHYGRLAASTERLSSGLRINSAADDAAGLAIKELMRTDVAALNQGARNASDAISLIQVADGALAIIDEKLIRMKELAEQAATGTYNSEQRKLIDAEFKAMGSEIERIARTTNFNGIRLLDGSRQGAHDGGSIEATGALKIHFGGGNDSAEDYYYIDIADATLAGLFKDAGSSREVLGFNPVVADREVPNRGDEEGQNILALPNGNMLIISNIHNGNPRRSLRLFEYDPNGNLVHEGLVPQHAGSTGVMQPKNAIVLPNGNVAVAFNSWGDNALSFVIYDSAWNVVNSHATPAGGDIGGPDDLAMSATAGSLLAGGIVNGNVVMAMTDSSGANPRGTITLGPGSAAASTNLGSRHYVVAQNGGNLEGYFVDDAGNVSAPVSLCAGRGAQLTSFGDTGVLVYSGVDQATGRHSSFARILNADGSVGEEIQINDPDAATDNTIVDIAVMRDEEGNYLDQVLVAWKNSANNGTLKAEALSVKDGKLATIGNQDMTFVEGISGLGLGPANIAVLADGSVAADWQKNLGGYDHNAFSVFKVEWGAGGSVNLDISTQTKAQKMLASVDKAVIVKDAIRANLGAFQNRLENTVANLSTQAMNLQQAASRISDADIAREMTIFVQNQILAQSAVAMLGQANSYPHMLINLIKG